MKALTYLSFALALGAVLLSVFDFAGSRRPTRASTVAGSASSADEALREELSALAETSGEILQRLTDLEERQVALELNPPTTASLREPVTDEVAPVDLGPLKDLAAALDAVDGAPSAQLHSLVLDVLASKEAQDRAERDQRRLEATQDRVNQRVDELREELGLNSRQANDMGRVLLNEQVRRDEFFGRMREGFSGDRESIRDEMRTIRSDARAEVETILAPDQYDRYVELEDSRRGFGGWGDRGRESRGNDGGGGGRRGGRDV